MIITSTAKRYAKALFELAQENRLVDSILGEFESFLRQIESSSELHSLLKYPNDLHREKLVSELFRDQYSPLFFNFLLVVLKNKRADMLQQIFLAYRELNDRAQNRVRANVITALPLTDEALRELMQTISSYKAANVVIENTVDKSIIGGIIIEMDGQEYNASLAEHFKKLKLSITKN
jgi:F-type H+-transporting ATPase subunit delta